MAFWGLDMVFLLASVTFHSATRRLTPTAAKKGNTQHWRYGKRSGLVGLTIYGLLLITMFMELVAAFVVDDRPG